MLLVKPQLKTQQSFDEWFYSGAIVDTKVKLIRGFGFIYYLE